MRGALVAAAGSGQRFGEPKQFLELTDGVRLVDQAVASCRAVVDWVGVVLPPDIVWDGPAVDATCVGASTRLGSLRAALAMVPSEVTVLVTHSASHPLASSELVSALCHVIERGGVQGAVPFLPAVDVIKKLDDDGVLQTVGREGLGAAQCPMVFERSALEAALTDDPGGAPDAVEESALVEAAGGVIRAVPGEVSNVHVIDAASLDVARAIAAARQPR